MPNELNGEELVLTPGGYRPKSKVHFIEPGHKIRHANGRIQKIDPAGNVTEDLGPFEARPEGLPVMPRNLNRMRAAVPGLGSGWITYADWTNTTGQPVSLFTTTWKVPPAPDTQSGQIIFLFNGIQNASMIYQPVLQWGVSAAGGGNYWAVASWYADGQGGSSHYSTLVPVNSGEVLVGVMTLTSQSAQGFSYDCVFQGIPNSNLTIQDAPQLTWCIETLEAYGLTKASDYPATTDTAFTAIGLKTGTPPTTSPALSWTAVDSVTDTGQHSVIVSDANPGGEVDLYFNDFEEWLTCLYRDLLGRAPDAGGLAGWISQMNQGQSYQTVANGFLNSPEYCKDIVTGFYQQFLNRAPDAGGLAGWTSDLEKGTALQQIILGFCTSAEYQKDNPVPTQFVVSLYKNLLGRAPDAGGEQGWIAALNAGKGVNYVVNGFLTSQEYCTDRITTLYTTLLGRQPDAGGLASWVKQMTGGTAFQQIQVGFLTSAEYLGRVLNRVPAALASAPGV